MTTTQIQPNLQKIIPKINQNHTKKKKKNQKSPKPTIFQKNHYLTAIASSLTTTIGGTMVIVLK